jgi:hypothetical protein
MIKLHSGDPMIDSRRMNLVVNVPRVGQMRKTCWSESQSEDAGQLQTILQTEVHRLGYPAISLFEDNFALAVYTYVSRCNETGLVQ